MSDLGNFPCRENTEGEYAGLEHEVVPDVVESLKIITEVRCISVLMIAPADVLASIHRK